MNSSSPAPAQYPKSALFIPGMRLCIALAGATVVASVIADAYLRSVFRFDSPGAIFAHVVGTFIAHVVMASFWSSFGPGDHVSRRIESVIWVGLLMIPFCVPGLVAFQLRQLIDMIVVGCVYAATTSGLLQLCFLPFAYWWRLDYPADPDSVKVWQFKMRHLLISTGIVAVILGLGRWMFQENGWGLKETQPLLLACGTLALPFVVTIPILRAPSLRHGLIAVAALLVPAFAGELAWDISRYMAQRDLLYVHYYFVPLTAIHLAVGIWPLMLAILWRRAGLRFVYDTERRWQDKFRLPTAPVSFEFVRDHVNPPLNL